MDNHAINPFKYLSPHGNIRNVYKLYYKCIVVMNK